jgi:regulator of sirC expression with transglutaminase-like and TPR domain
MNFSEFVRLPEGDMRLATGALLIAKDAYPALDLGAELARVDALAAQAPRGLAPAADDVGRLTAYLYEAQGFHGNEGDYYDLRNSFLNDVLDRRTGIPISLAVVFIEVACRAGLEARGVSFPGHFLVRVRGPEGGRPIFVDPFRGALLGRAALEALARAALGPEATLEPEHLRPATARHVFVRMLHNIKRIYVSRRETAQALLAQSRVVELSPGDPLALLERGALAEHAGALAMAADDFALARRLLPEGDGRLDALDAKLGELAPRLGRAN